MKNGAAASSCVVDGGFAALDGAAWHEALKAVAAEGRFVAELASDAVSRARAADLSSRDLRLLLMVTGDDPRWLPVRRTVMDLLVLHSDKVGEILVLHTQVEVWPPPSYEESVHSTPQGSQLHKAAARIGAPGSEVVGPARLADTVKDARQRAQFALLARLAGVPDAGDGSVSAGRNERLALPGMRAEAFEAELVARITAGGGPGEELEGEVLQRAAAGRLRHRDMQRVLFDSSGPAWRRVREAALERAALVPPTAATLLQWRAEQAGDGARLAYEEDPDTTDGQHTVTARLEAGEVVAGQPRSALSRKTAQHYAAVNVLASVCGLAEPSVSVTDKAAASVRIALPQSGQDAVKLLNKYTQLEVITKPTATLTPQPRNKFTCSYTCRHRSSGHTAHASASGRSKEEARRAAAVLLLRRLHEIDTGSAPTEKETVQPAGSAGTAPPAAAAVVPAQPTQPDPMPTPMPLSMPLSTSSTGKSAVDVAVEALSTSCALTLLPARGARPAALLLYRSDGRPMPQTSLPAPLAEATEKVRLDATTGPGVARVRGWVLPLREAVPVLLSAVRRRTVHPSTLAWEQAVRISLQLLAARLVYPALTEDGRAMWRVGPLPEDARRAVDQLAATMPAYAHNTVHGGRTRPVCQALEEFLDAMADAFVRTPASAVFGPTPYTGPGPTPLPAEQVRVLRPWLDKVEERVDGGPPPPLVLEVAEPTDEQALAGRLTARLLIATGPDGAPKTEAPAEHVWSGAEPVTGNNSGVLQARVRRVLRRAAAVCPALTPLADQLPPTTLTLEAAAVRELLESEEALAGQRVMVRWPRRLRTALNSRTVVGTATGPDKGTVPRFTLHALLDFRWQLALNDDALSEAEMDALAEAARPLVRVRGQWVLLDQPTARRALHRRLAPLTGTEALTAALTGTIGVDGQQVACRPADGLARVITVLRSGEHTDKTVPAPPGLTAALRGYQQRALAWLAHTTELGFGAVLADDMGLGKTLTAIAYALHQQDTAPDGPVLVVCPASLVTNWEREIARFAPDTPVVGYHGAARTLETATDTTIVITTYGVLRRDHTQLAGRTWGAVIADEAQYVKNHESATARHLRTLKSTTRIALTGTPVENNLSELWALLDWANPGLFGSLKEFRSRYATAAERDTTSAAAQHLARLVAPFLLRRRKSDPGIAPELPAKIHTQRVVQLTAEQAALYEAMVRETMATVEASAGITRHGLVFKLLTGLKQITNHPAHYLREDAPDPSQARAFAGRSAKLQALEELLALIRERNESALIFTSYVAMGRLLTAQLTHLGHRPVFLHGGLDTNARQRIVDAFQDGQHPVLILSLKAAGTGLNLTRASHVIHYDRSWNAAVEDQATDRAHRIGQHRTVTVHHLITEHTVEDRIHQLLEHKRALQDAVLSSGDQAFGQLTDSELADLVRLGASR